VLEKEAEVGKHQSGLNSGVIHAGLYYPKGSMKATFCIDGNKTLKEFCREHGIKMVEEGKVLVATNKVQLERLQHLFENAKKNGLDVKMVDEEELRQIEPNAIAFGGQALHVRSTAVVNPLEVTRAMAQDAKENGVEIITRARVKALHGESTNDLLPALKGGVSPSD